MWYAVIVTSDDPVSFKLLENRQERINRESARNYHKIIALLMTILLRTTHISQIAHNVTSQSCRNMMSPTGSKTAITTLHSRHYDLTSTSCDVTSTVAKSQSDFATTST